MSKNECAFWNEMSSDAKFKRNKRTHSQHNHTYRVPIGDISIKVTSIRIALRILRIRAKHIRHIRDSSDFPITDYWTARMARRNRNPWIHIISKLLIRRDFACVATRIMSRRVVTWHVRLPWWTWHTCVIYNMVVLGTQCCFTFCAHVIQTHTHEYDFRYIHFYLEFDEKCLSEDVMSVKKLLGSSLKERNMNICPHMVLRIRSIRWNSETNLDIQNESEKIPSEIFGRDHKKSVSFIFHEKHCSNKKKCVRPTFDS